MGLSVFDLPQCQAPLGAVYIHVLFCVILPISHFTDETAVTLKDKIICLRTQQVSKLGFEHQNTFGIS